MPDAQTDQNKVLVYPPDYTLLNLLGGDAGMKLLFSQERIRRCQDLIEKARLDAATPDSPWWVPSRRPSRRTQHSTRPPSK